MSYIWVTNVRHMKKKEKNIPYKAAGLVSKVQEPSPVYRSVKALPQAKDFTYSEFKKIADKVPFTQSEWAAILHISERKRTFGKPEMFYQWIKSNPFMLEGSLSFESLTTAYGIQMILTQLARIQHGILA